MRLLPLIAVSLAALAAAAPRRAPAGARGQKPGKLCPVITVSCPVEVRPGTPATFTANVAGGDEKVSPAYEWHVSAGSIASGQGTSSVTVDTTELPRVSHHPLTGTVEVKGYARECSSAASCTVDAHAVIDYFKTDEYGPISFADEKVRLDNYAVELRNGFTDIGYIICYGGRRGRRGEARARCARARNYLVTRHKIPARRVVTIDGGYMEELTVMLWPLPAGVKLWPQSTVDPGEVEFLPESKRRKGRARGSVSAARRKKG